MAANGGILKRLFSRSDVQKDSVRAHKHGTAASPAQREARTYTHRDDGLWWLASPGT